MLTMARGCSSHPAKATLLGGIVKGATRDAHLADDGNIKPVPRLLLSESKPRRHSATR